MNTAYATVEYYRDTYGGTFVGDDSELEKLLQQASRDVDRITFNRITALGLERLTEFQRNVVMLAVCRQAEYITNGGSDSDVQSYSINGVSVSYNSQSRTAANAARFDQGGYDLLIQTGLMFRGVR